MVIPLSLLALTACIDGAFRMCLVKGATVTVCSLDALAKSFCKIRHGRRPRFSAPFEGSRLMSTISYFFTILGCRDYWRWPAIRP